MTTKTAKAQDRRYRCSKCLDWKPDAQMLSVADPKHCSPDDICRACGAAAAPLGLDEMTRSTELLRTLNSQIAIADQELINALSRLGKRLTDEAQALIKDKDRHVPANGFVACTSLSQDVDMLAARLHALREVRDGVRQLWSPR